MKYLVECMYAVFVVICVAGVLALGHKWASEPQVSTGELKFASPTLEDLDRVLVFDQRWLDIGRFRVAMKANGKVAVEQCVIEPYFKEVVEFNTINAAFLYKDKAEADREWTRGDAKELKP